MKRKRIFGIRADKDQRNKEKIIKSVYRRIETMRENALMKGKKLKITTIIRRLRWNETWSEKMKTQQDESWRTGYYRYVR